MNPPDAVLRDLLASARTIAVVGASSNPERASNGITRKLMDVGYVVRPVNPKEREVLGEPAYPSLDAVPDAVDIVVVFRRAEEAPAIAEQAVAKGARALWLQSGIVSEEAARVASRLTVVMNACIGVAYGRLGVGALRGGPASSTQSG